MEFRMAVVGPARTMQFWVEHLQLDGQIACSEI